jgi:hypothetical protein
LLLELLEDRCTPATLGLPWLDPQHLTLSFVPDGTMASSTGSVLGQALSAAAPDGSGRLEILRAFQTWAVLGNVNIGLVNDDGEPLGTTGAVQSDPRFGDIRIAAQPLGDNVVALGHPFELDGSTWSGDVLLNSADPFGVNRAGTYDLFTVALHEAGHVFGLVDSSDPASAMFANYIGPRAGLSAQDVSTFQSLYGARQGDAFESKQGNDTWQTATTLGSFSSPITADISTLQDTDWYKVAIPANVPAGSTVSFQVRTSGISLLVPSLTVYDNAHHVLGAAAASSPLAGDLSVQVQNVTPGQLVYLDVGNATQSVFGIGSYQLSLSTQVPPVSPRSATSLLGADNRHNDTLATATRLTARNSSLTTLDFGYRGSISDAADVDYYEVHSPVTITGGPQQMVVIVSASNCNGLAPRADVFDAGGAAVPAQVIANDHGFFSIVINSAAADADYFIEVSALVPNGSHNVGNYLLGIDFNAAPIVNPQALSTGVLSAAAPQQVQTLTITQSGAVQLILAADAGGTTGVAVQMTVYDSQGNAVFSLAAYAGQPANTGVASLVAGNYTVSFAVVAKSGLLPAAGSWSLQGWSVSDPIGPTLVGTTPPTGSFPDTSPIDMWSCSLLFPPVTSPLVLSPVQPYTDPYYY